MEEYTRKIRPLKDKKKKYTNVCVPMRDGIELAADVYFPAGERPLPAILIRTCYNKARESSMHKAVFSQAELFTDAGYAVVIQDVRGRGDSKGKWEPFFNEDVDGYDSVEWVGRQDWCNGNVGMWGISYLAFTALMAARLNPPHLKAVFSGGEPDLFCEGGGFYMNNIPVTAIFHWLCMTNGHLNQISVTEYTSKDASSIDLSEVYRAVPIKDMDYEAGMHLPWWQEGMKHVKDDYWTRIYLENYYSAINIPVFHITGWYDDAALGTVYNYIRMANEAISGMDQYLLVGPWDHTQLRHASRVTFGIDYGPDAVVDIPKLQLDFFNYYINGKGDFGRVQPREQIFALRENTWHQSVGVKSWLDYTGETRVLYLGSAGDARGIKGNGLLSDAAQSGESYDEYLYDPLNPTPSYDGWMLKSPDWNWVIERDDTLVYTSGVLQEEVHLAGYPQLVFFASSSCKDTDFLVSLCDVHEDGQSIDVCGFQPGIRARYRENLAEEKLLEPGGVNEYSLRLLPTYNVFKPGHRIRIIIKSAHFPLYIRNHNTGNNVLTDTEFRTAINRIYHGTNYPTRLVLPVRDRSVYNP